MTALVTAAGGVTLVGGGRVTPADWAEALPLAPVLVAADSGADAALAVGHWPEAVIGDLDSISDAARAALPAGRLHCIAEQDSTDLEKCLTRIDAPFVLAIGFAGPRLDHALAALTVMSRLPGPPVLLLAEEDVAFLAPPRLSLRLVPGTRVSLWPMGPVRARSSGLRWPLEGIGFAPAGRIGTSNEATGQVTLAVEGPMLVLLPRPILRTALAALL